MVSLGEGGVAAGSRRFRFAGSLLPGAELVEDLLDRRCLRDQLLARVLLSLGALLLECVAEVRLELGPPAVVQRRPRRRTIRGTAFRQVCRDQGGVPGRVASVYRAD